VCTKYKWHQVLFVPGRNGRQNSIIMQLFLRIVGFILSSKKGISSLDSQSSTTQILLIKTAPNNKHFVV
jgi:hypothetical protein